MISSAVAPSVTSRPRSFRRVLRGPGEDPVWARPALAGLLLATAVLYLWGLGASGWANSFYAAAVQAGSHSWKAFFFGSSDAANFITVDKTPLALWPMDLTARVFGVNSWSILVPQALMGVATVAVLYATVRRSLLPVGVCAATGGALLAGAVLATTPVAALMFRFDNPDALLVLLLTYGTYALLRAREEANTRWLLLAAACVGLGFLAKMLQAFLVIPAFGTVYLLTAPTGLGRRLWQLALAGVALVVASGWWVAVVAVIPAGSRPYIGGSQHNSVLELALGYNGLGRLSGNETGGLGNTNQDAGWLRMFDPELGGQIAWLLPAALVLLAAGLWATATTRRPRPTTPPALPPHSPPIAHLRPTTTGHHETPTTEPDPTGDPSSSTSTPTPRRSWITRLRPTAPEPPEPTAVDPVEPRPSGSSIPASSPPGPATSGAPGPGAPGLGTSGPSTLGPSPATPGTFRPATSGTPGLRTTAISEPGTTEDGDADSPASRGPRSRSTGPLAAAAGGRGLPADAHIPTAGARPPADRAGGGPRTDRSLAAFVLWGGWLLVTAVVFSLMQGIFHGYYTVALAPPIAALTGIGTTVLWLNRRRPAATIALAAAVALTAWWCYHLLARTPDFVPWLLYPVLVGGLIAAVALLAWHRLPAHGLVAGATIAIATSLAGPTAYAIDTATTPQHGAIPSAGPSGGPGGMRGRGPGRFPGAARGGFPGGAPGGLPAGTPGGQPPSGGGTRRDGGAQQGGGTRQDGAAQQGGGTRQGGLPQGPGGNGAPFRPSGQNPGGPVGGIRTGGIGGGMRAGGMGAGPGALLDATTPSATLTAYLKRNAGSYTWIAAAIGSNSAAGYQLATGRPVMAIGGFNGTDPAPSLTRFQQLVRAGRIHYFVAGSTTRGGGSGNMPAQQITAWVAKTYTADTVDGTTIYDLSP